MSDVKPRRRDISAALTRTAVLDSARALFVTKGFDATSIDEIARASQSSNGAVYHHFRDKQEIFAEVFRTSQAAILQTAVAAMPTGTTAWGRVESATRAFLRSYVADRDARVLLGQAIRVLGWDRVHQMDEEMSLPLIRATLTEAIQNGEATSLPVDAAADLLFSLYCNAILIIAARSDPDQAAADVETVIFTLLAGIRAQPNRG
ncbi:TetR/AcrR family transcriptional regulator [Mycolicibacterium farcinogenes]|uniref:TetR/AcrR family transcriptional regulator n=1 Tax=Mycolicibacterium farcinogenes TaxID=1802 RepID=UPI001FD2054E|nr:TetR/AcrR family transcriptional regulator [Mycolicibacterium farcinogenes]